LTFICLILNLQGCKTINNYYIVIHPLTLTNFIVNPKFLNIFNKTHIFIVDKSHHLKTKWLTRSLSDATLMMMQYSHLKNNNKLFNKYILLSSSCCPIYNLDKIYKTIYIDNKSWINSDGIVYWNDSGKNIAEQIYNNNLIYLFSQWMILDKIHVKFFFINKNYSSTYIKKNKEQICNNISINSIYINPLKIKTLADNILANYLIKFNYCEGSDELFFCRFIFYKLLVNVKKSQYLITIFDNIKNIKTTDIYCNIPKNINDKLIEVDKLNNNLYNYIEPISTKTFEQENILNIQVPKERYSSTRLKEQSSFNVPIFTIPLCKNKTQRTLVKSTYTDWEHFSLDPFNTMRGFNIFNLDINKFLNNKKSILYNDTFIKRKIIKYIKITNIKNIKNIKNNLCIYLKNVDQIENIVKNKKIISNSSHPLEYSSGWTLRNIINAYIILYNIKCLIEDDNVDKFTGSLIVTFNYYHKIICEELNLSINTSYHKIIKTIQYKNKTFGTPITHQVILNAISSNSLFIRKCLNTSLIETYSHILCKL